MADIKNTALPPSTPSPDSRNEVIEECAKVCEGLAIGHMKFARAARNNEAKYMCEDKANALEYAAERIRSMKLSDTEQACAS